MIDKEELIKTLKEKFEETKERLPEDWEESGDVSFMVDCSYKDGYAEGLLRAIKIIEKI